MLNRIVLFALNLNEVLIPHIAYSITVFLELPK